YHCTSGLPAMAYTAQAHGFFTKLEHAALEDLPASLRSVYGNAENLARLARLETLARELSLPLSTVSLAYITSQPFPAYALTSCTALEQLVTNVLAGDVVLPPSVVAYLDGGA